MAFRPDIPVPLYCRPEGRSPVQGALAAGTAGQPGCMSRLAGRSGLPGGGGAGCGADEVVGGGLAAVMGSGDRGGDRVLSAAVAARQDLSLRGRAAGVEEAETAQ